MLPEPNYTQVPNVLLDDAMASMSLAELKCTLAIIRKTKGWHKTVDTISLSQLEEMTGLSRKTVIKGLQEGLERGTLIRCEKGQSFEYGVNIEASGKSTPDDEQLVEKVHQTGVETPPVTSGKSTPELVEKVHTQKKDKKIIKEKEAKLSLEPKSAFSVFEQIHPNYSLRLSQKQEKDKRPFDFEYWLNHWGEDSLRKLLGLAIKTSTYKTPQGITNTWFWYIVGDRIDDNVLPAGCEIGKKPDIYQQLKDQPAEEMYTDYDEWLAAIERGEIKLGSN